MIDFTQRLAFASDVVVQAIDGEALVLKLHDEDVFALNATAARIAQLIGDGHRLNTVIDTLAAEYGVSRSAIEPEVGSLVETLLAKRLVIIDHGDSQE
jgi:hypothetical protein